MRFLLLVLVTLGNARIDLQEAPEEQKARRERMIELRRQLSIPDEAEKLKAISGLGEILDDEALSLLGAKLSTDTDTIRIAAAHALGKHRKVAAVRSLATAVATNAGRPTVQKALRDALLELDMCACIPVLVSLIEPNQCALAKEALEALVKIGCNEAVIGLLPILQRSELEGRKPDFFDDPCGGAPTENRQKNKPLAAQADKIRECLHTITGLNSPNYREWAAAVTGGKTTFKRTSVYLCALKQATFEVLSDKPKKCPYDEGKASHEDLFLKHLRE